MSNKRYETNIEVKQYLNDEQKQELSNNLVQQEIQVALKEEEKKQVVSKFNSEIKDIRSLITDIVQKLNVGYQQITQTVECEKDSITGDKRYYDLITGELIRVEENPNLEDIETINMFTTEIEEQEETETEIIEEAIKELIEELDEELVATDQPY